MLKTFKNLSLISAVLISFFGVFALVDCIHKDLIWALIIAGIISLSWLGYHRLSKGDIRVSLVTAAVYCLGALMLLNERRLFVIKNGGWERADGYGSPLAFLLGLVFDLFWFIYFFLTAMIGLRILLKQRREQKESDSAINEIEDTGQIN